MNELQAAGAALASLKAAFDLTKAFMDVKGAVDIQGKVFELQRVILAAQQDTFAAQEAQSALLNRVSKLEKQLADMEAWNRESERYELIELVPGVFAYKLKPSFERTGPEHELCANCFTKHHKSILQKEKIDIGRVELRVCHSCGSELIIHGTRPDNRPLKTKPKSNRPFS